MGEVLAPLKGFIKQVGLTILVADGGNFGLWIESKFSAEIFLKENPMNDSWNWVRRFAMFFSMTCVWGVLSSTAPGEEPLGDSFKREKVESMYAGYRKSFPGVADISAEGVLKIMGHEEIVFVDVREPEEQAVSMLPGAVPHIDFLRNPDAYKGRMVIGYCTISYRSGKLARKLQKRGICMINLKGGILAWLHSGGKIYREGMPTNRVHVYGKKWDLAPSSYDTVW
jgi:sodium/bile acid cotransporter 7